MSFRVFSGKTRPCPRDVVGRTGAWVGKGKQPLGSACWAQAREGQTEAGVTGPGVSRGLSGFYVLPLCLDGAEIWATLSSAPTGVWCLPPAQSHLLTLTWQQSSEIPKISASWVVLHPSVPKVVKLRSDFGGARKSPVARLQPGCCPAVKPEHPPPATRLHTQLGAEVLCWCLLPQQ